MVRVIFKQRERDVQFKLFAIIPAQRVAPLLRIRPDGPRFKVIRTSRHVAQHSHGSCATYKRDERKTVLAFVCCQRVQSAK